MEIFLDFAVFHCKIPSIACCFLRCVRPLSREAPHNPKAAGSNPVPATKSPLISQEISGFSLFSEFFEDVFSGVWWADPNGDPYGSESGF